LSTRQPIRTCIATGEQAPQGELLRFVAGPDGKVYFDISGKAPGRGAYLRPVPAALEKALKRKVLGRHLKAQVPEDLSIILAGQLRQRALEALSLAKKAGQLTVGLEETLKARQTMHALILATDAGLNAQEKFAAWGVPTVRLFSKLELEQALGVPNTAVAGLTDEGIWPKFQHAVAFN
jgi:hypothetical protein